MAESYADIYRYITESYAENMTEPYIDIWPRLILIYGQSYADIMAESYADMLVALYNLVLCRHLHRYMAASNTDI